MNNWYLRMNQSSSSTARTKWSTQSRLLDHHWCHQPYIYFWFRILHLTVARSRDIVFFSVECFLCFKKRTAKLTESCLVFAKTSINLYQCIAEVYIYVKTVPKRHDRDSEHLLWYKPSSQKRVRLLRGMSDKLQ